MRSESTAMRAFVGVTTVFMVVTGLSAFLPRQPTDLTVRRINIVDADGKTRVILAGNLPPARRNDLAGLLFFNNDGREAGGLVYTGRRKDGKVTAGGALTLDQYGADQIVVVEYDEENGKRRQGITITDRPDSNSDKVKEFNRELNKIALPPGFTAAMADSAIEALTRRLNVPAEDFSSRRVFVGRDANKSATLALADRGGRTRLRLAVDSLGGPRIEFLDASGRVVRVITDR